MRGFQPLIIWVSTKLWFIKIITFIRNCKLLIQEITFYLNKNISDKFKDIFIFFNLVLKTILPFLFSIITVFAFYYFRAKLEPININNSDNYDNLLLAVASITGIFLSLYFTGMNTVVAGIYAKSPPVVRKLFIQERIGLFSVRFLTWLTLVSLWFVLLGVIFDIRLKLSLVITIISSCFAILFFADLGRRAFDFLDPIKFSRQLLEDLLHWCKNASTKGHFFTNYSFQFYYHEKAEIIFQSFSGLCKIAISEEHLKEGSLNRLITYIISAYNVYLSIKQSIPSKSNWFDYINKYKQWYLNSDHLVTIAAASKVELMTSREPDHYWLENRLEDIEIKAIGSSLNNDSTNAINIILSQIFTQFFRLGETGEIKQAILFHSKIEKALYKSIIKEIPPISDVDASKDEIIEIIGFINILCSYQIQLIVGFF